MSYSPGPALLNSARAARQLVLALAMAGLIAPFAHASVEKSAKFYEDALARYQKNDLKGASVQLKNALKENNKNLPAQLLFAKLLQQAGEYKAAEAAYEGALKLGAGKIEVAAPLAHVYLQQGNVRQLLETITPEGLPPTAQSEILTLRGSAMAMLGQFANALRAFADARALDPKSALPNISEAPVQQRMGDPEKAKALARQATEMAPQNHNAWYQLGTILYTTGDAAAALPAFDKAIALSPKHVDSRVSRVSTLLTLKRQDDAAAELKFLKDEGVKEPRASFMRAMLTAERGNAKAAQADYTEAANMIDAMSATVRGNSEPLLMAGALSHRALGQGEKSREYLEAILGRNGKHLAAQMLLATTLMESNELGRAVPVIESLLRANPNDAQALYMMGSVHLMRRQYAQASDFLERAAKAAPTGPALRELSFSQFGLGQDKSALANLEKSYAQNPKDYTAGIELAIFHARTGNGAKAVKIAQALVALDPNNLAMLNFLGNIKGRLGDRKGLREAYEGALAKDPKFRPVVMNMAWLEIEEGRLDAARIRLKAFLKDQPKDPDILFQLGFVESSARRPAEAIALWTEAERVQPKDPRPGLGLVDIHLSEQQADKALAAAKGLLANHADNPQVQLALARAYLASGDASLAKKALTDASSKAGTDGQALMSVARMQLQLNNPDGAAHAAAKVLQATPFDPLAMAMNVEVAGRRGNPAEIDKAMAQLQAKHPNHPVTLITGGHIAFSRGQMPKAVASYKSAFDRDPNTSLALTLAQAYAVNKEGDKAVALLDNWAKKQPGDLLARRALADMQLFTGKSDAARQTYEALSKAAPTDPGILSGYAKTLLKLGDPAAVGVAERAYKLAPTIPALMDVYGFALTQHGNLEAGLRILRDARVREPGNAVIRLHLAMSLAKSGKKAEAREELQAALSANPPITASAEVDKLKAEIGL